MTATHTRMVRASSLSADPFCLSEFPHRLRRFLLLALLAAFLLPASLVFAHDPGLSSANLALEDGRLQVVLAFSAKDSAALLAGRETLRAPDFLPLLLQVEIDHRPIQPDTARIVQGPNQDWEMHGGYPGIGAGPLEVHALSFSLLPAQHRQFATLKDSAGKTIASRMLSSADAILAVDLSPAHEPIPEQKQHGFLDFFLLGINHILTGYDHLLFLFALLLVCENFRRAAIVITCFTLAHSVSLALATFRVVELSSGIIEPLIAASIVYVGVENIWRKGKISGRGWLTFCFGLVHGLGFAGALRELGIGEAGTAVLVPLFSFNLGVETGQLAVTAVLFPLVLAVRRWPQWTPRLVLGGSTFVVLAGSWWFVERTLLSS